MNATDFLVKAKAQNNANGTSGLTLADLEGKLTKMQIEVVKTVSSLTGAKIEDIIASTPELADRWNKANSAVIAGSMREMIASKLPESLDVEAIKAIKDLLVTREKNAVKVFFYLNNKSRLSVRIGSAFNYSEDSKTKPEDLINGVPDSTGYTNKSEWFKS